MIGLVLAAHSQLSAEMLKAAEMIVGPIVEAVAVAINHDDSVETIRQAIEEAIAKVSNDGVIVMTDMFGGTPANMSLSFLESEKIEVLTGMNLPMLLKFAMDREKTGVADLASQLRDTGRDSITVAGDFLK